MHSEQRQIVDCNAYAEELFGWPRNELIGQSTRMLHVSRESHETFGKQSEKVLEGNNFYRAEFTMKRKGGETFLSDHTVTLVRTENRETPVVVSVVRDITDRKRQRERLIRSIIKGEDRERARIARELHDGLGQVLSAASMHLEAARDRLESQTGKAKQSLEQSQNLLKDALGEVRAISHDLIPRVIEEHGLPRSLETLAWQYNSEDRTVTLRYDLEGLQLDQQAERNLYRILQEALRNAARHSGASRIAVQLQRQDDWLYMSVEDNGEGAELPESAPPGSGLSNMKKRARALGGSLEVDGAAGLGTTVTLEIPLEVNTTEIDEFR